MDAVRKLISRTETQRNNERERLQMIEQYVRGPQPGPYQPRKVNSEYRTLVKRAETNFMPMMLRSITDQLYIEGYRRKNGNSNEPVWRYWQANGFDSRQTQIFRAACRDGYAYGTVMPGSKEPVMRGHTARRMFALYDDPVEDKWPEYALLLNERWEVVGLIDDNHKYKIGRKPGETFLSIVDVQEHGIGTCPVVRYAPAMDLDGVMTGDVMPVMRIQDRINQTSFDLLIAQTYGSFVVRLISGMEQPIDAKTNKPVPIELDLRRLLTSKDEIKGFQFDPTPLDPYINAFELAVQHFAIASQTPPHYLLAKMVNMAADAIAAAESSSLHKRDNYQHTLGESAEQHLELAAVLADGNTVDDMDDMARVQWSDIGSRSLAQAADALGKLSTQLDIEPQALWNRIPGWTDQDTLDALAFRKKRLEEDPYAAMADRLDERTPNGQRNNPAGLPNAA
jgi:hypothetical protein